MYRLAKIPVVNIVIIPLSSNSSARMNGMYTVYVTNGRNDKGKGWCSVDKINDESPTAEIDAGFE
jgi:hypothetical protein